MGRMLFYLPDVELPGHVIRLSSPPIRVSPNVDPEQGCDFTMVLKAHERSFKGHILWPALYKQADDGRASPRHGVLVFDDRYVEAGRIVVSNHPDSEESVELTPFKGVRLVSIESLDVGSSLLYALITIRFRTLEHEWAGMNWVNVDVGVRLTPASKTQLSLFELTTPAVKEKDADGQSGKT